MNEQGHLLARVGVVWMGNSDGNFGNINGGGFRLLLGAAVKAKPPMAILIGQKGSFLRW